MKQERGASPKVKILLLSPSGSLIKRTSKKAPRIPRGHWQHCPEPTSGSSPSCSAPWSLPSTCQSASLLRSGWNVKYSLLPLCSLSNGFSSLFSLIHPRKRKKSWKLSLETPQNREVRLGQQNRVTRTRGRVLNSHYVIPQQPQPEELRGVDAKVGDRGPRCQGAPPGLGPPHPRASQGPPPPPHDLGASSPAAVAGLPTGLTRSR